MPFSGLRVSPPHGGRTAARGRLSEQTRAKDPAVCRQNRQAHGISEAGRGPPPGGGAAAASLPGLPGRVALSASRALSVSDSPTPGERKWAEPRAAWRPRRTVRWGVEGGPVAVRCAGLHGAAALLSAVTNS